MSNYQSWFDTYLTEKQVGAVRFMPGSQARWLMHRKQFELDGRDVDQKYVMYNTKSGVAYAVQQGPLALEMLTSGSGTIPQLYVEREGLTEIGLAPPAILAGIQAAKEFPQRLRLASLEGRVDMTQAMSIVLRLQLTGTKTLEDALPILWEESGRP